MRTAAQPRRLTWLQTLVQYASGISESVVLRWLVSLALLQGLVVLFLAPPWQHYDEPAHFEYAAEIAARQATGAAPDMVALRREIADSMYRHKFWPEGVRPDLLSSEGPSIGEDQRVHPPLYYHLVAAPLTVLRFQPIEQQLYAGRVISLIFYVLTIIAAWRIAVVTLPDEPLKQLLIPLLLLLTPTFADLMTAVNNDVVVNFAAAASLLGAVMLLRYGLSPVALALALLGLAAALLAKRSAIPLIVPLALALVWTVWRRPWPFWSALAAAALALCLLFALVVRPVVIDGPSGPHQVLAVQPWLGTLASSYLRIDVDAWMRSVSDRDLIGSRYQDLLVIIFVSFWTRFGWSNVHAGVFWDWIFGALAMAACLGLFVVATRPDEAAPRWQRRVFWLFLVAVISAWLTLVARFHPLPPIGQWTYFPRGRYMFWSMVPHLWLLTLGLQALVPKPARHVLPLALLGFFVLYTLAAYGVFWSAYYR